MLVNYEFTHTPWEVTVKKTILASVRRVATAERNAAPFVADTPTDDAPPVDAEPGLDGTGAGGGPGMREVRERGDETDFGAHEPGVASDLDGPRGSDGVGDLEGPEGGTDVGPDTWRTREGPGGD